MKEFVVPYDFDALVGLNHARVLTDVLEFPRAANAREIQIVGYRAAVRLSNGQLMSEEADIGKRRAAQLAMLLHGANLRAPSYRVTWRDESSRAGRGLRTPPRRHYGSRRRGRAIARRGPATRSSLLLGGPGR
jgi:hypothetical protein